MGFETIPARSAKQHLRWFFFFFAFSDCRKMKGIFPFLRLSAQKYVGPILSSTLRTMKVIECFDEFHNILRLVMPQT